MSDRSDIDSVSSQQLLFNCDEVNDISSSTALSDRE